MKPCPFCGCKTTGLKGSEPNIQMVCTGCGAEGPSARDAKDAEILWNRRPDVDFWKRLATYFGTVIAATAFEYEAKSVSKSRRGRQISILTSVYKALLDGEMPKGTHIDQDITRAANAAASHAIGQANRLEIIQEEQS